MNNLDINNQLDEVTINLISSREKELESKDKEIDNLKKELEFLKAQLFNKNKNIFGQSSEKADSSQLSLFNEAKKKAN